jgi:hypothetical protein
MLFDFILPVLSLQVFFLASLTHQAPAFMQPNGQPQLQVTGTGRQIYSCENGAWQSKGAGMCSSFVHSHQHL